MEINLKDFENLIALVRNYQSTLDDMLSICQLRKDYTDGLIVYLTKEIIKNHTPHYSKTVSIEINRSWNGKYHIAKKHDGKYGNFIDVSLVEYFNAYWIIIVDDMSLILHDEKDAKDKFNEVILTDDLDKDILSDMGFYK